MGNVKSLTNHKDQKKAKIHLEHVESLIKITDLSIKSYEYYEIYTSASEILVELRKHRRILESQRQKLKGKLNE